MEKKTFSCPFCEEELIEGAKFCKKCGTRLNLCQNCNTLIKPGAQFCPKCGLPLSPSSAPNTPVPNHTPVGSPSSPISADSKKGARGAVFAIIGGVVVIAVAAGAFFHRSRSPQDPTVPIEAPETSSHAIPVPPSSAPETEITTYADTSSNMPTTQPPAETTIPSTVDETETSSNGLSFDTQDYILPESNSRLLTESDLASLSKEELRLARNEIYARYGRKFKDAALQEYFNSKPWYQGTVEPTVFDARQDNILSKTEIANLDIIKAHENLN